MWQYNEPELRQIAAQLSDWPLVSSGTEGYRTAEVTLGEVDTDELSSGQPAILCLTTREEIRVVRLYQRVQQRTLGREACVARSGSRGRQ